MLRMKSYTITLPSIKDKPRSQIVSNDFTTQKNRMKYLIFWLVAITLYQYNVVIGWLDDIYFDDYNDMYDELGGMPSPVNIAPHNDAPYNDAADSTCALLFFGLPKQFKEVALPSIIEHILGPNPTCDVYAHTYKKESLTSAINKEFNTTLHTDEVYLLPNATILMETEDTFLQTHNLEYYHQFFPHGTGGWEFPTSINNMIKQWHSIERVWSLMRQPYTQVGLFRLDVHFTNPINVSDSAAAVPNWGHWSGVNDRMFYGSYDNARVWANSRFPLVEKYIKTKKGKKKGLHSESYMRFVLKYMNIPFEEKPICFNRLRANGNTCEDCYEDEDFFRDNFTRIMWLLGLVATFVVGACVFSRSKKATALLQQLLNGCDNIDGALGKRKR